LRFFFALRNLGSFLSAFKKDAFAFIFFMGGGGGGGGGAGAFGLTGEVRGVMKGVLTFLEGAAFPPSADMIDLHMRIIPFVCFARLEMMLSS